MIQPSDVTDEMKAQANRECQRQGVIAGEWDKLIAILVNAYLEHAPHQHFECGDAETSQAEYVAGETLTTEEAIALVASHATPPAPLLTEEEREAIEAFATERDDLLREELQDMAATLHRLLARTKAEPDQFVDANKKVEPAPLRLSEEDYRHLRTLSESFYLERRRYMSPGEAKSHKAIDWADRLLATNGGEDA